MPRGAAHESACAPPHTSAALHTQDVIFDGTMMWAPFVEQTIAMVRDHRHKYRRGPGYHKSDGCNVERCASPGLRALPAHSTDQHWVGGFLKDPLRQPGPRRVSMLG